jgi:ATP dependent DNA ligase domain
MRILPAGFIAPCLPTKALTPPSGALWLHEIKHDGFRVVARKSGATVRLYSRPGNDLTYRFPLIVETVARLRPRSCIIDGDCGEAGGGGGLGPMTVDGKNRVMIFGPKSDGTYVVEFRTAAGEALAISFPEARRL